MKNNITLKVIFLFLLFNGTNIITHAQNLALTATSAHSGGGATGTPDYSAANYNDGFISTCGATPWGWVSSNGWIEYTWSSAQNISSIVLYKDNRPMTTCTIEYWNGTGYSTIMSYNNTVTCKDSFGFTPVTTTKLRFNTVGGSSNPNHREIEVYGISCSTKITAEPSSIIVCEKKSATFSITAIDVTSYQWQVDEGSGFNNVVNSLAYSGATSSTLTVNGTPFSFDGNKYRCMVFKSSCKDTSAVAQLSVNGLVSADPMPPFDTTCINATKDIEVKATGSIITYQWQMLIPGVGYIDVPQQAPFQHLGNILQIAGVPDTLDGVKFRCMVNGVCDTALSTETLLTVNLVPGVAIPPADVVAQAGDNVIFEVQASGPGARYEWQAADPDTFVIINNNGIYDGVKTNRLTVRGVSKVQNGFKFRCVIRGSLICNSPGDTSEFAVLTVNTVSVSMMDKDSKMILYPNPVKENELFIQTSKALQHQTLKYKVVDKTGKTLVVGNVSNYDKTKINVGQLPADIYIVEILNEGGQAVAIARFTKL